MIEVPKPPLSDLPPELRARIAADLAAGRTIALTSRDLADADIREKLPQLLEQVGSGQGMAPGPKIPGYAVLGEIGHGGMSTVYLARQEALGRHVALKIVPNWLGGQARARERLLHEARTMARLSHPHIVTIHDIVDHGDTVAIAMEYVDGLSLSALLRTLPEKQSADDMVVMRASLGTPVGRDQLEHTATRTFVRMMADIARAVHHVHQNGLLHLDIKPSNVLVRRDGTPLLADFGVVREIDLVLTHTRSFAGTPIYAAPEQLRRDDAAFGPRTDVYGLGITLYELLARTQPLRQEGLTRLLQDIQAGRIPMLSTRTEISGDLENIVHKAISPDPAHRYESAAAFADDLQAFLDGRPVVARPLTRFERLQRWVAAEPWKAAVAAVLLVLLPVSAGLGLKLLSELPTIRDSQLRRLREDHARLAQIGLQSLLVAEDASDKQIRMLETAWEEDPDDLQTLVCLITLQAHDDPDAARKTIDRALSRGCPSTALRMRRERLEQNHRYFTAEQIAVLKASQDTVDRLMLILDRIGYAQATEQPEVLQDLLQMVTCAALGKAPDPLLHGLRSWIAAHAGDRRALDESRDVMRDNWPTDGYVLAWQVYARDEMDAADAVRLAREKLEQVKPHSRDDFVIRMALLRSFVTARRWQDVIAVTDGIDFDLKDEQEKERVKPFAYTRALAFANLGKAEAARALLPEEDTSKRCGDARWLSVIAVLDRGLATARYRKLLETPRPPILLLHDAHHTMNQWLADDTKKYNKINPEDRQLVVEICERGMQCYPEDEGFLWGWAGCHWRTEMGNEVYEKVKGHTIPRSRVELHADYIAMHLSADKEWQGVLKLCDHWEKFGEDRLYRMHYFRGIARARLGNGEGAWESFVRHKELALPERTMIDSYLERAYQSVDPASPPTARNVAQAVGLLGSSAGARAAIERRALTDRNTNPWFHLMLAEVHFAEGDRNQALELLASARKLKEQKVHYYSEPKNLDELLADAERRYTK